MMQMHYFSRDLHYLIGKAGRLYIHRAFLEYVDMREVGSSKSLRACL